MIFTVIFVNQKGLNISQYNANRNKKIAFNKFIVFKSVNIADSKHNYCIRMKHTDTYMEVISCFIAVIKQLEVCNALQTCTSCTEATAMQRGLVFIAFNNPSTLNCTCIYIWD